MIEPRREITHINGARPQEATRRQLTPEEQRDGRWANVTLSAYLTAAGLAALGGLGEVVAAITPESGLKRQIKEKSDALVGAGIGIAAFTWAATHLHPETAARQEAIRR